MIGPALALSLAAAGLSPQAVIPTCTFRVTAHPAPQVIAPAELTHRAWVMPQPDSPVAIAGVDLTGFKMTGGPGAFGRSGRYAIDVQNVSNEPTTDIEVVIWSGFYGRSGVGNGHRISTALAPGERKRFQWESGAGRGTSAQNEDATVVAYIDRVTLGGCTYQPSKTWPALTRDSRR